MPPQSREVPALLRAVLSDRPALTDVNALVNYAHHLAITRLKQLVNSGRLHLESFPLTLESAAIDCIAELFERDTEGQFVELAEFYSGERSLRVLSGDAVTVHFHSLVFTKLRDGIFSLYEDNDPILSKIIRNTKEAIPKFEGASIVHRLGISYIRFGSESDSRFHLHQVSMEDLENSFSGHVRGIGQIRNYLAAAGEMLNARDHCSKLIPLIDFAVAIKRTLGRIKGVHDDVFHPEETATNNEIQSLVEAALNQSRAHLVERYVGTGKLTAGDFEKCFAAIRQLVFDTFVLNDGSRQSYESYLREQMPHLKSKEYLSSIRAQFEYMAKLTKKSVRDRLKDML